MSDSTDFLSTKLKIYFHLNLAGFSNCYVVVNEECKKAIIIDPGQITEEIISQLEEKHLKLSAILISHNHGSHVHGLETLRKIYSPKIFAADWEVAKESTTVINGDGFIEIAGLKVWYFATPGHTPDSMIYKIGNVIFTGDVLSAGKIGSTNSSYSEYILKTNIENKIFSQTDGTILMPGHGPPMTIESARMFNHDI